MLYNKYPLVNIIPTLTQVKMIFKEGIKKSNQIGIIPGYGPVLYSYVKIANVFAL